ncbi:hypothetical protein A2331_06965 [Candidatus Falkowbacteria bacterium RIFOXYB2_FULL_34_18]|uniref:Glutamyl-tRNA amidotransferase n=1 Tax=Candidatus Falkowbacteria bacterium RIFOXYD2_FULL_34_120 TaxID=1798007 RepID=A0A1F5TRI6_9BACT|nr:MAG: hypothetical protein A2331_06965 [Candidatus Falkowbacteria bacterium RIFOXYB2_FULL_34_18]OGF29937.1 MAG: hypothetical protein A2500_03710 [Candidatus Falkowbacteria bacterium RIFOXYC12_FULL_34_55]OGF37205.1 MAG: hypothetical protein A2466_02805 [Candidatus Falkowbacteria bacterium RIFOXYC2_FULL_34_220]OGF39475.1 MAG: hypothetical protein A2515_04085 [Candidatus Falkowbacteria bacterium RIFOXYD12_FULL_34_57]OGF41543.1 MAG: hypothetical protein A2531_02520 [Candidatus Falkowbacteria bact
MANLFLEINNDLKQAMRDKKALELSVLRMLLASLKNKKIELIVPELNDDQVVMVIKTEVKKRKDSVMAYKNGNREDLAEKELAEIKILEKYMPEQMGEEEVEKIVKETIDSMGEVTMQDFGKIMGAVMNKTKGQADGNAVSAIVKKILK